MADEKSYEERQNSAVEDFQKEQEDIKARALAEREAATPDEGETEEEYRTRIASIPGIFGDTDTTAGGAAAGTDVPSANNELAQVAAAEVEAEKQDADEDDEVQDVSHDEARRQVDVAGPQPSAEEVDAGAEDTNDEGKKTANDVVGEIEAAGSVDEVNRLAEGDDRVTVQRAADKRRGELS